MPDLYPLIRPLLFQLAPETAHNMTFGFSRFAQAVPGAMTAAKGLYSTERPELAVELLGMRFKNPVGIAAGFDKNGLILETIESLGFGFVEVGSVTNLARVGNPKPRIFRLDSDKALINRMGLNNDGPEAIKRNIEQTSLAHMVVGVNIAKTHDPEILGSLAVDDMRSCLEKMISSARFISINVSCPNTAEGKTFENPESLHQLLSAMMEVRNAKAPNKPMLVKFSPDISKKEFEACIKVCEDLNVDGYVCTNTSSSRDGLKYANGKLESIGKGGLSGKPIFEKSRARVAHLHQLLGGKKPIIGVGGIDSAESAYEMIRAGASMVEIYTGLIYRGPSLSQTICKGLSELLKQEGAKSISEMVGLDSGKYC